MPAILELARYPDTLKLVGWEATPSFVYQGGPQLASRNEICSDCPGYATPL